MAPIDRRLQLWAWLVRRQASIAGKSEAAVITLQSRHAPSNAVSNFIFGTVASGTEVSNRTIPGPGGDLPVRIYRPATQAGAQLRPLVLNVHGGGFVFGDLRLCDWLCSQVAVTVGAVVVSVDYRLAPRHRFPAASALIQVGEHDPLRADGVRYAAALRAAGVPVRLTEYVGMPHGYLNFPGLCRIAPQALAEICAEQTAALAQPVTDPTAS
jgi:acetyl esterase